MSCTCKVDNIEQYENFQLKNFNTLKMSSVAPIAYFVKNSFEFKHLVEHIDDFEVLGWGSNTLLSSSGFNKPVVVTKKMDEISFDKSIVEVQAGASVQKLSKMALDLSLSGFEFLYSIPSSLGGAVAMNAGACGQSISDNLLEVCAYDMDNKVIKKFEKAELDFSYRNSLFKKNPNKYFILSAKFELIKSSYDEIKNTIDNNVSQRKASQPSLKEPNLGSVFKNPQGQSAGLLIDKCGLKGETLGGAQVYLNHGNFVINKNEATSVDYINLLYKMYCMVKDKFQIELELEIEKMGSFSDDENEKWKVMKNVK